MAKRRKTKRPRRSQGSLESPRSREVVQKVEKAPEKNGTIKKILYGTALVASLVLADRKILSAEDTNTKTQSLSQKVNEGKESLHILPELEFVENSVSKKPAIAKHLDDEKIEQIANKLTLYCEFHMKEVGKLVEKKQLTDRILGKVVMILLKDANKLFARAIPGFQRPSIWNETIKNINEFLEYNEKYLFVFRVEKEKIINLYDISAKYDVNSTDSGKSGRQFLLNKPRLSHYSGNTHCAVTSSNQKLAVCFDENIKRYINVNKKSLAEFDIVKSDDRLAEELYESSRYHESVHIYHYKKYPKFAELRFNKGPKQVEAAKIDELCALGAELSQTKDLVGALSLVNTKIQQYLLANQIFIDLMSAKLPNSKIKNNPSVLIFNFIKSLRNTSIINEVGRQMHDIGINKLEASIAE